ncbi:MAG: DNA translocase FtsK, partial [Opitutales bacterium]
EDFNEQDMGGFKIVRSEQTTKARELFPERKGDYQFPSLDLLMDPPETEDGGDEDHMKQAQNLRNTLAEFKIDVELGEVHTGPVITRYDVHPAPGVRVEKIANLDRNLAMALKADSVRILAPVPGKGCVGIEVPNAKSMPVCLKEILESTAWADVNADIPIVLGKEASGKPLVADLAKMPHLLIAGSTGSGKTVCMNAIIASLCFHSSPEDVRFIMVDPKIVEMKVYNDLPHMLIPVVTDPKKVPAALKWLLIEMERRYQIFAKVGVRNLAGFNAKILKDKEEKAKADALDAEMTPEERSALANIEVPRDDGVLEIPESKLPYIVCIVDELADLMMVAQADVETGIARLAQLARAAGIHLIIATQRPSVNVITGVIKANLPSRISFRVASLMDSRTILDGKGAEALIGKGDMLFIPPGSAMYLRAQGAFVSDDEINGIVEFLKCNGPPDIVTAVQEQIESAGEDDILGGGDDGDSDPMFAKALEVIRATKRASTSNLQRKLRIGYNRAARIMDELEERGIVGSDNGAQPREILKDLDSF